MKTALLVLLVAAVASAGLNTPRRFLRVFKDMESLQRIVGGQEAVPHSRPYQVGLIMTLAEGKAFCGGSLISKNHVLTAAHCVNDGKHVVTEWEVILGAHNIYDIEGTTRIVSKKGTMHPDWNPLQLQNDLAIIELPEDVQFSDTIKPVTLPPRSAVGNNFKGKEATASGWGLTATGNPSISEVLNVVTTPVIGKLICEIPYLGMIQDTHICTSGLHGMSTCSGDSGGPLTTSYNGQEIQVGIVSFGIAFGCEIGWPAVYTRVTEYLDWIAANGGVVIAN